MRFRKYRLPKMKSDKLLSVLAIVLSVSLASCGKPDGDSDLDGKIISELTIRYPTPKYVQEGRLLQLIASQPGTVYSPEKSAIHPIFIVPDLRQSRPSAVRYLQM